MQMKKVLIIGHFWPYRQGSGRVLGLAKHLMEFGWQPIIITAPLHEKPDPQFRVIETPCPPVFGAGADLFGLNQNENTGEQLKKRLNIPEKSFRKSFLAFFYNTGKAIVDYPDAYKGWKSSAIKAGDELLQNEDVGALISIWPVTSHLIAKELKIKHKIPWVADLPDPWSQNHNYSYGSLRKLIDRRLELKTLLIADALTTVTQPWAENLKMLHKRKSVYAITHGFDPDTLNMPPADLTAKYTITYTGAIYTGKQDPSKLFAALRDLISDGTMDPNDIEVRFYGHEVKWLASEIEEYELSTIARYYGTVPPEIAIEKQRESQLLLLLNWDDPQEKGVCPLKIYAYLSARRPILATGGSGDDVVKELLDETNAGRYAPSVDDIKGILKELYSGYKLKGEISYNGDLKKINRYSHREMARKFAEVLDIVS